MKAQSHLKRNAINRSFMTHGESFTTKSVPNNVVNKNLFSSAVSKFNEKVERNVLNQK